MKDYENYSKDLLKLNPTLRFAFGMRDKLTLSHYENNLSDERVLVEKPKQIRIKRAIWRYNEDGTYNIKPLDETYFNNYYHEKLGVKVECPYCKKFVVKPTLDRHIRTVRKCLIIQNKNIQDFLFSISRYFVLKKYCKRS